MKESESEVLKIKELESELLGTDSTALHSIPLISVPNDNLITLAENALWQNTDTTAAKTSLLYHTVDKFLYFYTF
jgi:hypothetical protein